MSELRPRFGFEIFCPHGGSQAEHKPTLPDYHPINQVQILDILRTVSLKTGNERGIAENVALVRFGQAVDKNTCPEPRTGPVAERLNRIGEFYGENSDATDLKTLAKYLDEIIHE